MKDEAANWEDIAIELDFTVGEVDQIKKDNPGGCKACLRVLLSNWLKRVDPKPSWSALAEAVEEGTTNQELAGKIRKKI